MGEVIASTYEIIEKIGSGGGGVVYLANHLRLGKKVVLKADKRKLTSRPEVLRREVDALKNLSHTYIPQVYDFFVEGETVYTVIDYIEGESFDRALKRGEKFSQPQVIKWACQLLEALAYLHSPVHGDPPRGIVHSDIKPANIMLRQNGDICLIDFNIALALGEENVIGLSVGYASPEHYGIYYSGDTTFSSGKTAVGSTQTAASAGEGETLTMGAETVTMSMRPSAGSASHRKIVIPDARSDIYSLGATLYHFLSGNRPAKSVFDVVPLSEDEFSKPIVSIISKAMNPNPDLRYQTAEEMLYDFKHLRENDPRTIKRKKVLFTACPLFLFILLCGAASVFTGLKRIETAQRAAVYAEYSQNALEDGDPGSAVEYALEALSSKGIFSPGYLPAARKALAAALGVYDLSDGYKFHKCVELNSEVFKLALSPDGKTGAAFSSYETAVFDSETGVVKTVLPMMKSALSDIVFADDDILLYAGENGLSAYNTAENSLVWTAGPATHIAVSADGKTAAGIYKDEDFACVYDIDGNGKAVISFEGRHQHVLENDTFADPFDNLLSLSGNGEYLAVSFEDGGLTLFNTADENESIIIYDKSDFTHFEGGFNGKYFVYSASNDGISEAAVIDLEELIETTGLVSDSRIGVQADEKGIFLSNKSIVVSVDPSTGEQKEAAYADSDIRAFCCDEGTVTAATENNDCLFYDEFADKISGFNAGQFSCSFVNVSGDFALEAGRDAPTVRILKKEDYTEADICSYDPDYYHDEARINTGRTRLMLFSYKGFRIYDMSGNMINETSLPDAERVYDQQYSKKSGNLAVIYSDAFRLYSGEDGKVLYEADNLKSVLYASYGVSIFDKNGNLKLIDIDTGLESISEKAEGDYAAYCGIIADSGFLSGKVMAGAGETAGGICFAAAEDNICTVYNEDGKELFKVPMQGESEAFFTDREFILSPLHGTPEVYSLKNGKKIADLEKDTYLAYIVQLDDYIISDYISASGSRYSMLLDKKTYEPLAYLPGLSDNEGDELIFDFFKGELRSRRIYPIETLIKTAKEGS